MDSVSDGIKYFRINYEPNSSHQIALNQSEAYERVLIAGLGAGKTISGAAEFLILCAQNIGLRSMIISPTYPMAKRTTIPTLIDLMDRSGIEYTFNKSDHIFYLTDIAHTIDIGSAEIPMSLKGSNLSHIWFDETSIIPYDAYRQGIARVRLETANRLSIIHTFTPEVMTWCYDEFILSRRTNREVIFGRTVDNPALGLGYVDNLTSRYSIEMQRMYLDGEFVFATDRMIVPEWKDEYVRTIEREDEYKFYCHYVVCDWGIRDKTAILWATWDFKRALLYVEAEATFTNKDAVTSNIAAMVIGKRSQLWGESKNVKYVGDSSNAQIIQDLNIIYRLPFVGTTKSNMSDNPERIGIKQSMVNDLRETVRRGQFIIDPSCKETIGNFRSGIWNERYDSFERTETYGHFDLLDAGIYLNRNVDKLTNPIPGTYYWNSQKAHINTAGKINPIEAGLGFKKKVVVNRI